MPIWHQTIFYPWIAFFHQAPTKLSSFLNLMSAVFVLNLLLHKSAWFDICFWIYVTGCTFRGSQSLHFLSRVSWWSKGDRTGAPFDSIGPELTVIRLTLFPNISQFVRELVTKNFYGRKEANHTSGVWKQDIYINVWNQNLSLMLPTEQLWYFSLDLQWGGHMIDLC